MDLLHLVTASIAVVASLLSQPTDLIVLNDGSMLTGKIRSVSADGVSFAYTYEGAPVTGTFARDRLEPHSWFVVRSSAVRNDAPARLELARYAIDHGMYGVAEHELDRIIALDASLELPAELERTRARDGAAKTLLGIARAARAEGDLDRAWNLGGTVLTRYRDSASDADARAFVDELEHARAIAAENAQVAALAVADRKAADARAAIVKPARQHFDKGQLRNIAGLKSSDLGESLNAFHSAAGHFQTAMKAAAAAADENANDLKLVELAQNIESDARRSIARAHVNMGSLYVVRGSYVKALEHANEALAANPDDGYAEAFRARVEIASAEATRRRFRRG
jgi:tetratricopeptide (TPR) repeat protein